MPLDMLDRIALDPGTRTLGELMQEREWAVWEVRRLRSEVSRLSRQDHAPRIERERVQSEGLDSLNAERLLRLAEVSTMVALCRSAIYQKVSEGSFPAPIKVGVRGVRWKFRDVLEWCSSSGRAVRASCPRSTRRVKGVTLTRLPDSRAEPSNPLSRPCDKQRTSV
jgi:prophage regulatory protein